MTHNTIKFLISLILVGSFVSAECRNTMIALDIRHSPQKQGAYSSRGIGEYQFNKAVAISLFYSLKEKGCLPFFINPSEADIKLSQRTKEAEKMGADIFISIHHDSVKEKYLRKWNYHNKPHHYSDKFSGYGIFVSKKNKYFSKSLQLGKEMGHALRKANFTPSYHHTEDIKGERKQMFDRELGIYRYDNLVVLKRGQLPSVLIEGDIIVNRDEELMIMNSQRQENFVSSITKGVLSYITRDD